MKRQLFYATILFIFGMLVLEGLARIVEGYFVSWAGLSDEKTGWQQKFFGSLLDWHEPEPELLWRFRANLNNPLILTNSAHLLGPDIMQEKDISSYRVLLLGDSSPVGLGLSGRRQAFGEIARYLLDKQAGGRKKVELVNAAVSGYTSEQIVRFLSKNGWNYDPDLVILYCGNNDASISGYASDEELLASRRLSGLKSLLSHSALYRLMRSGLSRGHKYQQGYDSELTIRVSAERYGDNLAKIYRQCRQRHCPLLILKPPVPHLWPAGLQFKPFIHMTDKEGALILPEEMVSILGRDIAYCISRERFQKIYGEGDIFTKTVFESAFSNSVPAEKAVAHYIEKIAAEGSNPLWYNNLGVAFWRDGKYEKADSLLRKARKMFADFGSNGPAARSAGSAILFNIGINLLSVPRDKDATGIEISDSAYIFLDSALQDDYFSLRIKRDYWRAIDSYHGKEGVVVIDLPEVFRINGGEKLFIDHCHPTPEGHRIIAREILEAVKERNWL